MIKTRLWKVNENQTAEELIENITRQLKVPKDGNDVIEDVVEKSNEDKDKTETEKENSDKEEEKKEEIDLKPHESNS